MVTHNMEPSAQLMRLVETDPDIVSQLAIKSLFDKSCPIQLFNQAFSQVHLNPH